MKVITSVLIAYNASMLIWFLLRSLIWVIEVYWHGRQNMDYTFWEYVFFDNGREFELASMLFVCFVVITVFELLAALTYLIYTII